MLYINNQKLEVTRFPDLTSQVWKLPEIILDSTKVIVTWEFDQESEFLHLAQLKTLLDKNNVKANLHLTYLPYGRQDKEVSNTTTFALTTFANLLNTLNFEKIFITDPHSNVALDLIKNTQALQPISKVVKVFNKTNTDIICFPDKGALNKYKTIYNTWPMIYGEKVRNQLTGNIEKYKLIGECKDKNVLIVDDICDGGATFQFLAQDLLKAGAKEVNLFVTHGIFSKGIKPLKESGINRIFCQKGEVFKYQEQLRYDNEIFNKEK